MKQNRFFKSFFSLATSLALLWVTQFTLTTLLPVTALAEPAPADEVPDPFEGFNRAMFTFNDTLDIYLLEPVATGYDIVVPDVVESSVSNFFLNLRSPIYIVSDLFQFRFNDFAVHTGRFLINSTVGIGGLFDVAKHLDMEHVEQDFGLTLGRYGLDTGPYIVLPIFGPTTARDMVGRVVDRGLDPLSYTFLLEGLNWEESLAIDAGAGALEIVNFRARHLSTVRSAKEAALDYYLFVRSAYFQRRRALVEGRNDIQDASVNQSGSVETLSEDEYIFDDEE